MQGEWVNVKVIGLPDSQLVIVHLQVLENLVENRIVALLVSQGRHHLKAHVD